MISKPDFEEAYKKCFYTITGAGGDNMQEWIDGYDKLLKEAGLHPPVQWYRFSGEDMNEQYGLTGDNAYQPDLNFLAFSYCNHETGKLAIFKVKRGDRWFNDIVDNNKRAQAAVH